MSWKGFRHTGNPSSRSQRLLPAVGPRKFYGNYRRVNGEQTEADIAVRAFKSAGTRRRRSHPVTLPDKPFDFRGDGR